MGIKLYGFNSLGWALVKCRPSWLPGRGYPVLSSNCYLYEREAETLGSKTQEGAITAIGAVSPPGGDTSEPVSQATLRIVKVFWGLSATLAYRRHFPAIDWLKSYSLYDEDLVEYFDTNIAKDWSKQVREAREILQEEAKLEEIVRLVGVDSLEYQDRLTLEVAHKIREDFLHQIAFDEVDTYTSLEKQYYILKAILIWYHKSQAALRNNVAFNKLITMNVLEPIGRMKYVSEKEFKGKFSELFKQLEDEFISLSGGEDNYA